MAFDLRPSSATAIGALLRLRLFYKLLIANSAIVVLGAIAGTVLTARFVRAEPQRSTAELLGWLAAAGVVVSVAANAAIVRLALRPLGGLESAARAVREGNVDARAPLSPLADSEFRRVAETFNEMVESVQEHRERLREMASRAIGAAEEERRRIARELHDGTAQSLAAILVRLRVLESAEDADVRGRRIAELKEQVLTVLEEVRRTAHGLRPQNLEELGLGPAIRQHARSLRAGGSVPVEVEVLDEPLRLPADAELALYRIVQEAMTNAVRHADATHVRVRLWKGNEQATATVEDDGKGFEVAGAMAAGEQLGLFGMQERAAYFGGTVAIDSSPGAGTRVRASLPIA